MVSRPIGSNTYVLHIDGLSLWYSVSEILNMYINYGWEAEDGQHLVLVQQYFDERIFYKVITR